MQEEPGANELMSAEDLAEIAGDAGKGKETVTTSDMALPFLTILQALSPQVNKRGGEYIDGAEPGMILNTVTNALYNELLVVPASYKTRYTEWKPRDQGGGLVKDWGEDSSMHDKCTRDERNRVVTPAGTNITKSATFFGLIHPSQERCIIAFSSTQLKKGRQWVTQSMNDRITGPGGKKIDTPLFFRAYKLTTVAESNDKGDWFGWRIEPMNKPLMMMAEGRAFYAEAKKLAYDVASKKVIAKAEGLATESDGEKVPF